MLTAEELNRIATALLQQLPEYTPTDFALHIGSTVSYTPTLAIRKEEYCLMANDERLGVHTLRSTNNAEEAIYWALSAAVEGYLYHCYLPLLEYRYRSYEPMLYAERKRIFNSIGMPYAGMDEEYRAKRMEQYPPSDLIPCIYDLEKDYHRIAMQLYSLSPTGKDYTSECNQHIHNLRFRKFCYTFCSESKVVEGFVKMRHAANEVSRMLLETSGLPQEARRLAEKLVQLEQIAKRTDEEISSGSFDKKREY